MNQKWIAAAVLAVCVGGAETALACQREGRTIYRTTYLDQPAPVGEYTARKRVVVMQPVAHQRHWTHARRMETIRGPEPVGEIVTTRRVYRDPQPRRVIITRTTTTRTLRETSPEPVGEYVDRRDLADEPRDFGEGFARVVTTPFRWVGNVVSAPFRGFRDDRPEPVAERVTVTKTTKSACRYRSGKQIRHQRRALEPVGERITTVRTTKIIRDR